MATFRRLTLSLLLCFFAACEKPSSSSAVPETEKGPVQSNEVVPPEENEALVKALLEVDGKTVRRVGLAIAQAGLDFEEQELVQNIASIDSKIKIYCGANELCRIERK